MEHLIMPADKGAQPTDRVVLATSPTATGTFPRMATAIALMLELRIVDDHPSRRTNQLADHPTPLKPREPQAHSGRAAKRRGHRDCRDDVLVVAIDVHERAIIRSRVIPNRSPRGCGPQTSIRQALELSSDLMLDLSEHAAPGRNRMSQPCATPQQAATASRRPPVRPARARARTPGALPGVTHAGDPGAIHAQVGARAPPH